jgi:DNA-binding NarL/FixJ family response regulator
MTAQREPPPGGSARERTDGSGLPEGHKTVHTSPEFAPTTNDGRHLKRVILLADGHPFFRAGMRYLLQDELAPAEVVEASSRKDVLDLVESSTFDMVITSVFSGEGDREACLERLLQSVPAGKLMILSSVDDPSFICRALQAGAAGFVLKETPPEITLHAIRLVLAGGIYVPPAALSAGIFNTAPRAQAIEPAKGSPLSERQRAILELLVQGASNKAIARSLNLSAGTVKAHVTSLLRLYGAENRTKLVHVASGGNGSPTPNSG